MTRMLLSEAEGYMLLKTAGIPVPVFSAAQTPEDAARIADSTGYPVVMKVSSREIVHKSDAGGVVTGIRSAEEARTAFDRIIRSVLAYEPGAAIDGILVEQQLMPGLERSWGGRPTRHSERSSRSGAGENWSNCCTMSLSVFFRSMRQRSG